MKAYLGWCVGPTGLDCTLLVSRSSSQDSGTKGGSAGPVRGTAPLTRSRGDGWGWASRLTVLEGSSNDVGMLVWTSFLAAPFEEVVPRPTLLGRALWKNFHGPSVIESAERPDARPRTAEDE